MIRGVVLVVCAACAWGTWSLFLRPTGLPPAWTSTLIFAFVALVAVPLHRREPAPRWTRATVAMLIAFAISDAVNVATFFAAMSVTSVAIAVLTHSFAPLFVALAAPFVEGQRVRIAPLAACVALAGIALLLRPWEEGALSGSVALGAALGTASAVAYAANVFLARRLTPAIGAARTMGLHAIGSALLLLPLALATPARVELADLGVLAIAAALLGVAANVAFAHGLVAIGSSRAAILAFVEPLVACAIGVLAWGEPLGASAIAGGALIVAAGVMVARAPGPEGREHAIVEAPATIDAGS